MLERKQDEIRADETWLPFDFVKKQNLFNVKFDILK